MTTPDMTRPLPAPDLDGCELVLPLVDWVEANKDEEGQCPPCNFAVITPWYRELLDEQGYPELAQKILDLVPEGTEDPDIGVLAAALDEIKESVDNENVKGTLTLYDCLLQTHAEDTEQESSTQ